MSKSVYEILITGMLIYFSNTCFAQNKFKQFSAHGFKNTVPHSSNLNGVIAGRVETKFHQKGMIYDGNYFTIFDVPGALDTQGYGINDAGEVVGLFHDSANHSHGFLRIINGTITTINFPGAINTVAGAINNADIIVGHYELSKDTLIGFVKQGDKFTSIIVPGAKWTIPYSINNNNVVAGWYLSDKYGSFLYDVSKDSIILVKDVIHAKATVIWSINDHSEMAGFINDSTEKHHGLFIDKNGKAIVFDLGNKGETVPFGINNNEQIIGFYGQQGLYCRSIRFKIFF